MLETVTQEADDVARRIEETVRGGERAYRDFAILVRANADADPFLRSLNMRGVPVDLLRQPGTLRRGRRCGSASRSSGCSPAPMTRSASTRWRPRRSSGCPPWTSRAAGPIADRRNRWLFDVLRGLDDAPELREALSAEGAEAIRRLVKELERYMGLAAELGTGELLYQFLADSGWLARMSRAGTPREEAEVQNVARFFRRIQEADPGAARGTTCASSWLTWTR